MNGTIQRQARKLIFHAILSSCAIIAAGFFTASSVLAQTQTQPQTEYGTWLNADQKGKIALRECGEKSLCGEIVWLKDALDEKGQPWTDRLNPDPSFRNQPVVGTSVLIGLRKIAPQTWQGHIYDPEVGKVYYLKHLKLGQKKVEIKGCLPVGWPCRTKYWIRTNPVSAPEPMAIAKARPAPRQQRTRQAAVMPRAALPRPATAPARQRKPQLRGPIPPDQAAVPPAASDVTAAIPRPATSPNVSGPRASGYLVQVAARQSQNEALRAYDELRRRFPQLLGGIAPEVLRADLGTRGVWYRVGVGPMEQRSAAADFCQQLKARGADCLIRRR